MQQERWYQHFHMLPQADQLIGHDQETVRLYLSHFYTHWVGNKQALRPHEFEEIVKMYAQPEAARGSIAWYRAGGGSGQVTLASGNLPPVPINHLTMILWGETDPIAPPAWADRLGDTFSHLLGVQFLPGIGHFVPFEAPEAVVEEMRRVYLNERHLSRSRRSSSIRTHRHPCKRCSVPVYSLPCCTHASLVSSWATGSSSVSKSAIIQE